MVFSSNVFLFLFLPLVLGGYYLLDKRFRNTFLFFASLFFYAWGEPRFVFVMLFSILFNYLIALVISMTKIVATKRLLLFFCVAVNLGLLGYYKYMDFFIINFNRLFGASITMLNIALPIGVSFFTFQALSYVIDVYRGTVAAQSNPMKIGLFISFFPQLIAGPIVRYSTIENQINSRQSSWDLFTDGCRRFIVGLSKKVILANNLAMVADSAFNCPYDERGILLAWIGAIAYSFQIYYDFSGYSDMAIGLAKMFGFEFEENFNYPYLSKTISEFWRRWHISLGTWFRDYVYFPLGGSRVKSKTRLAFNLFIVWILTGLWHGANWTFVFWGLLYYAIICLEKLLDISSYLKKTWMRYSYQILAMLLVMCGWVLFRADNMQVAGEYFFSMLGLNKMPFITPISIYYMREQGIFLAAAAVGSINILGKAKALLVKNKMSKLIVVAAQTVGLLFCLLWSLSFIEMGAHNPFIYFNF
ncbi:MBOAT family protein [Eubacteriales bacterium OttesenSCG-928-M02]|nr:MBOAT family protein [Eubacteriales bacterium OttesenSCG-928-M02]